MNPFRALLLLSLATLLLGCARRDVLVVGMDATYPPFEFVDEQGRLSGISTAIGEAVARELGKPVEFKNLAFDGLIPALQTGRIDLIISSLTANGTRREQIDFSDPYVKTGLAVLVAMDSPVQSAADLRAPGRRLAVRLATTGEQWCRQELPQAQLVALDTDAACVLEVVTGRVDASDYDPISVMNYHAQHPQRTGGLLAPLREEAWAVGLKKGRDDLRQAVNRALARLRQEGEFEKLAERYLARERALMRAQGLPFVFE
jgi:polar amino acid transport system substrate-binding protein